MVLGLASQPAAVPRWPSSAARALLVVTALALCGAVTWFSARRADQGLRAELLQQARLVAQALNLEHIQTLSGTNADLDKPEYRRLTEQIRAVVAVNTDWRWAYLMGRRSDGALFFYLDSEPATSQDHAAPGQEYPEAPECFRRAFAAGSETVDGPYTDRWGTWISALVPLADPAGGAPLALVGLDIDARVWKWDVAAQAAPLIGLVLVLVIGATAALASSRRRDALPTPVLRRLLVPLAAMISLLMLGAGALLWQQHRQRLTAEITADLTEVTGDLRVALEQQTAVLNAYTETVVANPALGRALRERDVEALLAAWQPEFERLRRDGGVTHFYVLDAQRLCLLRLHRPEQRGDRIERFTAREAERTGRTASGIELGSLGTFTLRLVHPVFDGATLLGYVELGREIEDVLQTLHTRSGNHVAVTLSKAVLERSAWESGMRTLGREPEWDRLPGAVVAYASQGRLPEAFLPLLNPDSAAAPARRTVDGEVLCNGKSWRVSTAPLLDASATVVGQLLVMRDISAAKAAFRRVLGLGGTASAVLLTLLLSSIYVLLRRTDAGIRAQQTALRESAESYRGQFAQNSAPMLLIDPADGALVDANAAAVAFYGYPREQLLTLRISDLNTLPAAAIRQAMASVSPQQGRRFVFQHRLADGSLRDVEVSSSRIRFGERSVLHSIIQDITERRQAEARVEALLAESNQARQTLLGILEDETRAKADLKRLATVVEQATETVLITDTEGTILYVNPAFEAVTGYARDEAIGRRPRLFKSARQDEASYRQCQATIAAGRVWQGRFVGLRKDATQYTAEVTASPVFGDAGQIVNYVAIGRDVSEQLRVADQLQQAQKMETIGRLAGGVAHDFNNLLTGIMNYVELCRDELPTPHPAREYLDEITHDAERSAGIARQLLAFARKQVIAPQVLDLNDALAGMLKMLRHLLGEDIDLTWQPGAVLWEVRLDPSQLDQILANLTVNARDAIGGVGALAIETRNATLGPADCAEFADAVPGEYVMLAVSDSGCGMDADTLRHLFEPFFTTKGVGEGTGLGLGLATIYGIVRQNGGFIAVTSELGKGTTFRIYLPRSAAAGAPATAAAALPACRGGTETILLVEDERSVRTTSRLFLEALGYTVLAAADPEDAIHLAAAQPGVIDLLVTDVVMPGLNGCDLARHLASQRPTLKCLFMSGYTADTIAHRGLLDQDLHFLAKPFLRDGLARKVRDILDEPPATPRAEHSDVSALALEPPL